MPGRTADNPTGVRARPDADTQGREAGKRSDRPATTIVAVCRRVHRGHAVPNRLRIGQTARRPKDRHAHPGQRERWRDRHLRIHERQRALETRWDGLIVYSRL